MDEDGKDMPFHTRKWKCAEPLMETLVTFWKKNQKNKTNPKEKKPMTHLTLLIFFSASSRLHSIMHFIHVQIHKNPQILSGIKNCDFLHEVFCCRQLSVSALPPDPWVLQPWFSTEAAGHPSSGNSAVSSAWVSSCGPTLTSHSGRRMCPFS